MSKKPEIKENFSKSSYEVFEKFLALEAISIAGIYLLAAVVLVIAAFARLFHGH